MKSWNIALLGAGGAPIPERSEAADLPPLPLQRKLLRAESGFWRSGYESGYDTWWVGATHGDAELVTSELVYHDDLHMPVLDIDAPVRVVESSPGRSHVYIDVPMTWRQYRRLLKALMKAGVIEKDWYNLAYNRRWSSVRPSWKLKKGADRG